MNSIRRTHVALLALAAAAILIVSACGASSDSGAAGSAPASGSNATETVSVSSVDGVGKVLVDAKGAALYAADQEAGGMVVCDASCTTIWDPLTVGAGKTPSAGDGLTGKLATVKRPDGAHQVTFDGRLLYRFAEDPSAETVTGNGFADTFDGQSFTWHVVTPTGVSTSSANSSSSSSGSGYGY